MKSVTSKTKLWIIITVAIVALGMICLAIFGLNKSVDYKSSYEVVVSVDDYDINNASKVQDSVEKYFEQKSFNPASQSDQVIESGVGFKLVYKFAKNIDINTEDLAKVVGNLYDASYNMQVKVEYHNVEVSSKTQAGWVALSLAIVALVIFLYVLIFEKGIGALSMLITSVVGALMTFSSIALFRIPVDAYLGVSISMAFGLSAILSSAMINRFREEMRINDSKNENKEKLSFSQIADKGANDSLLRFAFVFFGLLIVSLVFGIFGSTPLKFLALNLLVVNVISIFVSFVGTAVVWTVLKNCKRKKA